MKLESSNSAGGAHRITQLAESGIRVISERVPGVHSVALGVWIACGSRHETDQTRGYAHFMEHLLFKGNDRLDAADISRYFDGIGSDANAATTREYVALHSRVLDRHVPGALDIFGEMIFRPAFAVEDVEAEREVILEEIAMYDDSPNEIVHEIADSLVFPEHSLGMPIVGSVDSIRDARVTDIREFHRTHVVPQNLVFSAAGAIDHDEFVALVEKIYNEKYLAEAGHDAAHDAANLETTAPAKHEARSMLRTRDTEQVHIVLGGRGVARFDERRHALALLDCIVGNAPSSRLFMEIRERRGLAYSVYSFLANYADCGEIGLYVGVRPDRVDAVFEVLRIELDRLVEQPPSQAELELAIGQLEGRMLLSMESTVVRGNRLGASLTANVPIESLEEVVAKLRQVTVEDIHELARELFAPEALSLAVVAEDVKAVARSAEAVGLLPKQVARVGS